MSDSADDSFHPLGPEWEADLEATLDETEYDTELGLAMAEDAMAVTAGELSEETFHERYHEAVLSEFGQDDRPTAEAAEQASQSRVESLTDLDGDVDRRAVLATLGAAGAALGLGNAVGDDRPESTAAQVDEGTETGVQWGMSIDLEICDGCLACMQACQQEHRWDPGMNWMYVMDWESPEADLNTGRGRLVRPCQHCTDAPCEKVCPTTARHTRGSDGLVLTDYDVCIGCRYCQVACPYGVNYFQWNEPYVPLNEIEENHYYDARGRPVSSRAPRGVMSKCTFCPTRQDGSRGQDAVGTTACEDACPPGAIQFGDMNDEESDPQQYLSDIPLARLQERNPDDEQLQAAVAILTGEEEPAESAAEGLTEEEARSLVDDAAGESAATFQLLAEVGTDPNVIYVGNEPGPHAEQVPGPISYEEAGLLDNEMDRLEEGTVRFE
ncbi:Fe-S-cluster-containing hydrogenase subunit [Halovivax ruber XH-70]|uniref:Fe-S-cluster-containing hydrogenase subunit n=1 Tax=Halovivax ruber (strain DSM 18193 / JCM 13892 / XH-70) TaxID=797302 RepID=L0IAB6_HALRX|nr:4Fe-4S ferredoxin N-terminal domain-containing protein [Halovivax ruber]AGB16535.1 Fe-S-cluster-containing hydrogenase subunit [Halovivax ruber XH-70]